MKEILHLLLTALSLIARPISNFTCHADHRVFPLSQSKLESLEKHYCCKKDHVLLVMLMEILNML